MGLEAINFAFRSDEKNRKKIELFDNVIRIKEDKFVYNKNDDYWIDIEIPDAHSISIRITLCNPTKPVLKALNELIVFLFELKNSSLTDIYAKKNYTIYNYEVRKELEKSYLKKKEVFIEMYGDYTAAISSEEFYRRA